MSDDTILEVKDLRKLYPTAGGLLRTLRRQPERFVHAIDGISFTMQRGEILGLVGESGSGKTTTALHVMGLVEPTAGDLLFNGRSIPQMARSHDRMLLRRQVQMVFQDPYEALNPRQTVFNSVAEPLAIHSLAHTQADKIERVRQALSDAGLKPPENFLHRYPEELSGGQRQRVVIAGAIVLEPQLLVADEPVSMLDVSIRAEILNLLRRVRDEKGISILYITHDLATAGFFTDRIAVMYLGRIVEIGSTKAVLTNPQHPYTRALLSVVPVANPRHRRRREILKGEIPNPIDLPRGCRFHPRCPVAIGRCSELDPALYPIENGHQAACLLVDNATTKTEV